MTLSELQSRIQLAISQVDTLTKEAIEVNKQEILDLNRKDQLFDKGIDSEGNKIIPAYKSVTIDFKIRQGRPINRVTLFDTGDFYKGFDILYRNNRINIFSRDDKSSLLQDKYGSSIFGLTDLNAEKLNYQIVKPYLWNGLKKILEK